MFVVQLLLCVIVRNCVLRRLCCLPPTRRRIFFAARADAVPRRTVFRSVRVSVGLVPGMTWRATGRTISILPCSGLAHCSAIADSNLSALARTSQIDKGTTIRRLTTDTTVGDANDGRKSGSSSIDMSQFSELGFAPCHDLSLT